MRSGCLGQSKTLCRTKRSPFVKAYLEGVPKPQKVIDRIAGADLTSSNGVDFFTTAPRYIDVKREQRISSLFFHHILYPAGGARAPYQPIVVRGGRGLRRAVYPISPSSTKRNNRAVCKSDDEIDPLRVPDAFSFGPKRSSLDLQDLPESAWAASDPARTAFFFSPRDPQRSLFQPHEGRTAMRWTESSARSVSIAPPRWRSYATPVYTGNHQSTTRDGTTNIDRDVEDRGPTTRLYSFPKVPAARSSSTAAAHSHQRGMEDSALLLLVGSLEAHLNSSLNEMEKQSSSSSETCVETEQEILRSPCFHLIKKLLVQSSLGLLKFSKDSSGKSVETSAVDSIEGAHGSEEAVLSNILRQWKTTSESQSAAVPLCGYLPLQLPEEAVVKLSLPARDSSQGPEKVDICRLTGGVEPFVPFAVGTPFSRPLKEDKNLSQTLFAHINVLARVSLDRPKTFTVANPHSTTVRRFTSPSTHKFTGEHAGVLGTHLDPFLPLKHRTFIERGVTEDAMKGDSHLVIGRNDAEMYFVPHRPLLLTIFVPSSAEDRCAEQNDSRVRKQVKLGHQRREESVWTTSGRLTSDKKVLHQHNVIKAGNDSGRRSGSNHLTYNIKAIPGDVVYIPRGWGMLVKRILGSVVVSSEGEPVLSPDPKLAGTDAHGKRDEAHVDVDGFFILYKPYPVLTPAQSAVYVSANYVHGGISDFYEKGGNSVYHQYQ